MCKSVERYADQKAIITMIETSIELGANKEKIIDMIKISISYRRNRQKSLRAICPCDCITECKAPILELDIWLVLHETGK